MSGTQSKRKPNFLIVWNYLSKKQGERKIELFPEHGLEYGVLNNRLHHILHRGSDDLWCVSDIPFNFFIKACEELPEDKILSLIFEMGIVHESKYDQTNTHTD